jgi:hypothetical protein
MLIGGPLHFCVAHLRASCVSAPRSPDIELAGSVSAPLLNSLLLEAGCIRLSVLRIRLDCQWRGAFLPTLP